MVAVKRAAAADSERRARRRPATRVSYYGLAAGTDQNAADILHGIEAGG